MVKKETIMSFLVTERRKLWFFTFEIHKTKPKMTPNKYVPAWMTFFNQSDVTNPREDLNWLIQIFHYTSREIWNTNNSIVMLGECQGRLINLYQWKVQTIPACNFDCIVGLIFTHPTGKLGIHNLVLPMEAMYQETRGDKKEVDYRL